ncbi:MAG: RNA-binding protein, partial [Euryarchaeota archaeon HGW-Euryarchaeota-1]
MTTKLFIGNLSFDTTDEALKELFSQAGNVKTANIVKNKFSGRSRGFGFIEMETDAEATKAIELLNNKEVEGRQI